MKCPACGKEMEVLSRDVSSDSRNGKTYDRTHYVCREDDIWAHTEIPQKTNVST